MILHLLISNFRTIEKVRKYVIFHFLFQSFFVLDRNKRRHVIKEIQIKLVKKLIHYYGLKTVFFRIEMIPLCHEKPHIVEGSETNLICLGKVSKKKKYWKIPIRGGGVSEGRFSNKKKKHVLKTLEIA